MSVRGLWVGLDNDAARGETDVAVARFGTASENQRGKCNAHKSGRSGGTRVRLRVPGRKCH